MKILKYREGRMFKGGLRHFRGRGAKVFYGGLRHFSGTTTFRGENCPLCPHLKQEKSLCFALFLN